MCCGRNGVVGTQAVPSSRGSALTRVPVSSTRRTAVIFPPVTSGTTSALSGTSRERSAGVRVSSGDGTTCSAGRTAALRSVVHPPRTSGVAATVTATSTIRLRKPIDRPPTPASSVAAILSVSTAPGAVSGNHATKVVLPAGARRQPDGGTPRRWVFQATVAFRR